jgi:hypothetical protein
MSIEMTIRLVLLGALAGMLVIGMAMGQDTYTVRRRNRLTMAEPAHSTEGS